MFVAIIQLFFPEYEIQEIISFLDVDSGNLGKKQKINKEKKKVCNNKRER